MRKEAEKEYDALRAKYNHAKTRGEEYKTLVGQLIDNIVPGLRGQLAGLSAKILEIAQKKDVEAK